MSLKINTLKYIDGSLGKLLCKIIGNFVKEEKSENGNITNILIIRPGGIGDAVLLLPAIRALKNGKKEIKIDVLAEKRNSEIFKITPYIENLYLYDDIKNLSLFKVLGNSYDAVIDTEQWHRLTAVVSYMTGTPVRVGFSTNERSRLFTHRVEYSNSEYEAQSFFNLISELYSKPFVFNNRGGFLNIKDPENIPVFEEYRRIHKKVAGIFSGATVKERRWGVKNYSLLADMLLDRGYGVVLLGGYGDMGDSRVFERMIGKKSHLNLIGKTSLAQSLFIISKINLLISADSGLMHLAYAAGTPTLSLFGAGIEEKWAPRGSKNKQINLNLPCSPCTKFGYTPKCPINVKCLGDIEVEEVYKEAIELVPN